MKVTKLIRAITKLKTIMEKDKLRAIAYIAGREEDTIEGESLSSETLAAMFLWKATPHGENFWEVIYTALKEDEK